LSRRAITSAGESETSKVLTPPAHRPRSAPLGRRRSSSSLDRMPDAVYEQVLLMMEDPSRYSYQDIIDIVLVETTPGEPSWLRAGLRERLEAGRAIYVEAKSDENLERYSNARDEALAWVQEQMRLKGIAPVPGTDGPIKLSNSSISRRYHSAVRAAREIERTADIWARTWKGADATQTLAMIHTASSMLQAALIEFMAGGASIKQLNKIQGLLKAAASYARAAVEVEKASRENRRVYEQVRGELAAEVRRVLDEHPRERDIVLKVVDTAFERATSKAEAAKR